MIAALLLAALLQEPSASETLQRIEGALDAAAGLSIKYAYKSVSLVGGVEDVRADREGDVLLKKDNKIHAVIPMPGDVPTAVLVSDGKKTRLSWLGRTRTMETPVSGPWVTRALARAGVYRGLSLYCMAVNKTPNELPDASREVAVSEITFGDEEGGAKSIKYGITMGIGSNPAKTQVWYDPKTFLPVKRIIWLTNPEHRITETYKEFRVNRDLADEKFSPSADNSPAKK